MANGAGEGTTGGMAALQVAQAHLSTLLAATDALDSKATFIVAVNVAFFGVFLGSLVSSGGSQDSTPWIAVTAPAAMMLLVLLLGWLTVRPRSMAQFVRPRDLLRHQTGMYTDDQLAWSYVASIDQAIPSVTTVINDKVFGIGLLALCSVLHLIAIATSVAVWIS